MKKIILFFFSLFIVGFIIHSCRQEANTIDEHRNETGIQKQIDYLELISKIGEIEPDILKIKSSKNKKTYEQFQIDSTKIIEIKNSNGNFSYSMRVYPIESLDENNNAFYNLYLQKTNDIFTHTIVKYIPSNEYTLGLTSKFTGSYEVLHSSKENIEGKSGNCYELVVVVPCDDGNVHKYDGPEHCNGFGGSWHLHFEVCSGGGGSSGGSGGSSGGGGTMSSGSGSVGGGDGDWTFTPNPDPGVGGNPGVLITPDGDPIQTPCEKTKKMLEDPVVQPKIDSLKDKSKDTTTPGELGFKVAYDGTPTPVKVGEEMSIKLGTMVGYKGKHHNHPPDGIPIHSAKDIYNLFEGVVSLQSGTPTNDAFVGAIGSEPCTGTANGCVNGYRYFHHIIRYNGTMQDAANIFYNSNYNFIELAKDYQKLQYSLVLTLGYSDNGTTLNNKGLEKLIFLMLVKMGIDKNDITLQRIEEGGNVKNIYQNTDGTITDVPCP